MQALGSIYEPGDETNRLQTFVEFFSVEISTKQKGGDPSGLLRGLVPFIKRFLDGLKPFRSDRFSATATGRSNRPSHLTIISGLIGNPLNLVARVFVMWMKLKTS
jgi:hypothetical protein